MRMDNAPVIVVGAGLAGLTCARHLAAARVPVTILEALDRAGGRLRTDMVEGFHYRMLAGGATVLPAGGMEAIPAQLAAGLPSGAIRFNARVEEVKPGEGEASVRLESGEVVTGEVVMVAAEGPVAARLTGAFPPPAPRGVTCLYFAAERAPVVEPILVVDGEVRGPVTTLSVPSVVAPSYAPPGGA